MMCYRGSGEAQLLRLLAISLFLLSAIPVPQASTISSTVSRVLINSRHHHGLPPRLRFNEPIIHDSRPSLSNGDLTTSGVRPRRELVDFQVVVPDFYAYCYRDVSPKTNGSCGSDSNSIGPVGAQRR